MPSYRPPISRDQFHMLEAYYFRLVMFTDSFEYKELNGMKKAKIDGEISYISIALDIMTKLYAVKGRTEKRVVAWRDDDDRWIRIFKFSCIKVASMALDCNQSKISAVCKGNRPKTGGYYFKYEDEYDNDQSDKVINNFLT